MLGIQIRSKIRKRLEERAAWHNAHCSGWAKRALWAACLDIQPTHNLHCRQLLLQGDQGLVAHYDDDNTMIMMILGIILIVPRHPNSPQLGNQGLFEKNYESDFPNTSRLKIYERSRSSSDERKGRPPGAPSLLYELRCYFHLFIFLMLLKLKYNLSFSILWCLRSHCDYRYDHEKQHLVLVVKECRVSLYCCCLPNIYQKWTF